MGVRTIRLRRRDLALFLVLATLLGALTVSCGLRGEQFSLSLSVSQQICETEDAWRSGVVESYKDEDGNWVERETVFGWWRIPSASVKWRVTGGQVPYTLMIDHESRDENGDYEGASGTAQVGCADASVGTSFWPDEGRMYAVDPQVDSGWKTVRAVVTDANGTTAEAMVQFYVLYSVTNPDRLLRRGETYRVFGRLFTIPDGADMRVGPTETGSSGSSFQSFYIDGTVPPVLIWFEADTFAEVSREVPSDEGTGASGSSGYSESEVRDFHKALDAFAGSIGRLPILNRSNQ